MTDPTTIRVDQYLAHPPAKVWRALHPQRLLRWTWRGGGLDTMVTWTLAAEGRGTRLFLEHSGFDPDDPLQRRTFAILDGGWRSHVWRRIEQVLDAASG
jgi:uncharacterized protein YndB with AHSA1/START domain